MEYSSSKGFYIGFKATVVIDFDSLNPVCILIHSGAPGDAKLFDEIMKTLQKRHIIQKGDLLIFDKGYYNYENYQIGISKIKSFLSFFQEIISKETNSMINYPVHYKILRKQRKL